MKIDQTIKDQTFQFALRIISLSQFLREEKQEFTLSSALVEAGTIIGARVRNMDFAQSTEEFSALINFCIGEAKRTQSIAEELKAKNLIEELIFTTLCQDIHDIVDALQRVIIEPVKED